MEANSVRRACSLMIEELARSGLSLHTAAALRAANDHVKGSTQQLKMAKELVIALVESENTRGSSAEVFGRIRSVIGFTPEVFLRKDLAFATQVLAKRQVTSNKEAEALMWVAGSPHFDADAKEEAERLLLAWKTNE